MTFDQIAAVLLTLAAALSYINHRFIKWPATIGLMAMTLLVSAAMVVVGQFAPGATQWAIDFTRNINFEDTLMHGMLGSLLFAGALHIDLGDLAQQKKVIAVLATAGVVMSTLIVGTVMWLLLDALGSPMRWLDCMLFGALISPTDPIAVIGILKTLGAPKSLSTKIAGESLFNDGVGVVAFLALLGIAGLGQGQGGDVSAGQIAWLFVFETGGGAVFGFIIGYAAYRLLKSVDRYQVEILISLALVTGGYALATALHISGPIAMVVAGLLIGNHGRTFAMSDTTRRHLDTFWELIDEILNAVLFLLIGLEVLILQITPIAVVAGVAAIVVVLAGRFASVALAVTGLKTMRSFSPHAIKIMTWAGLRGGISVALALILNERMARHGLAEQGQLILVMTYIVVVFSIIVQGLTVGRLIRRCGLIVNSHDSKS